MMAALGAMPTLVVGMFVVSLRSLEKHGTRQSRFNGPLRYVRLLSRDLGKPPFRVRRTGLA